MRSFHKILSLLLALTIVLGAFAAAPLTVSAADQELPYKVSGECGAENPSDVEWYAFDDNSMVFFGTGAIKDYTLSNGVSTAPWYGHDFEIIGDTLFATKISVEYGITRIGDYCFYIGDNYPYNFVVQLQNIDIANTVTSIGKYAFYNQKIQQIIIPPSVTHIGANAFKKCTLTSLSYYGDPDELIWESDGEDSEFPNGITCHILRKYADKVNDFNTRFAYKHITFVADAEDRYSQAGEDVDRNIALYYGTANSRVFGGAAPYIIVGRFDGKKKSVTHGSNGFASCVSYGNSYYLLTDSATGALNKANINSTSGKAESYEKTALSNLKLHITHEYVGTNTVKVIYTLENTSDATISDLKLGGTGDIKIGADDTAAIEPLKETINNEEKQVGFYMKSTKDFDKSKNNNYATLGFIGNHVEKTKAEGSTPATYYDDDDAHFFYGKADANKGGSAVGSKTVVLIPERVFNMNNDAADADKGKSQSSDTFNNSLDSGMSYYWDKVDLAARESKQFAVLFSVYGTNDAASAQSMITDLSQTYHTVTWKNWDGSDLFKQVVKHGDQPVYNGATPLKPRYQDENYTFCGWKDANHQSVDISSGFPVAVGDTTYYADYTVGTNKLFHEHALTLHGDIGVIFFLDVTPEEVDKGVTVKFKWRTGESIPERSSEYTISQDDYDRTTKHYKAKCWVAAAEMTYNIHADAYFQGNKYEKESDDYSVRKYGETIIENERNIFSPKLVDLAKELLNYGAKAQLVFDRRTDDLATANFSKYTESQNYVMSNVTIDMIDGVTTPKSNMSTDVADLGLRYWGSSLIYLTKTTLRHYYTVTDGNKFTPSVKNSANFNYGTKDGGIYFDVSDIPAAELHKNQDFTITDVNGNTKTYSYSPLHYCKLVLMQEDDVTSPAEKDLAKATYLYNRSALNYFNSINE